MNILKRSALWLFGLLVLAGLGAGLRQAAPTLAAASGTYLAMPGGGDHEPEPELDTITPPVGPAS